MHLNFLTNCLGGVFMKTSEQKELMDFFDLNREMTPEEKRKLALCEEYKKKFTF